MAIPSTKDGTLALRLVGVGILGLIVSVILLYRIERPRESLTRLHGSLSYLSHISPNGIGRQRDEKDMYLMLSGHNHVFELFTGKEAYDFSPRIDRLHELQIGDEVEVYFEEAYWSQGGPTNKFLCYLDKDNEPYFRIGDKSKYLAYVIAGLGALLIFWGISIVRKLGWLSHET